MNTETNSRCQLSGREEIIEAYILNRLPETEKEAFEAHVYGCDVCFEEVQFLQDLEQAAHETRQDASVVSHAKITPKSPRSQVSRRSLHFTAAATFLILAIMAAIQLSRPQYYSIAKLIDEERKSLIVSERGQSQLSAPEQDFRAGATALLQAQEARFLFFPYFDRAKTDNAISHLRQAYRADENSFKRNKYAYFIGKAYLMQANADSARVWLQRILDRNDSVYQKEVRELLNSLAK